MAEPCFKCGCIPFTVKDAKPIMFLGHPWCTPCYNADLANECSTSLDDVEEPLSNDEVEALITELNTMDPELQSMIKDEE
jgi:hypothetical protein